MKTVIDEIADAILDSKCNVFLTGAGISTESGVPDYRSSNNQFWGEYDSKDFYLSNFLTDGGSRMRCWRACAVFYETMKNAQPNPAHLVLAELERRKLLRGIITQNVDGLHQKAGNSRKVVIELHGTAHTISCVDCGRKYNSEGIYASISKWTSVPYCEYCQGILKPDTVFPGEPIIPNVAKRVLQMATSCKLLIVIGSSLEVQPAAYLPLKAKEAGARLGIINLTPTPYDKYADYLIYRPAGKTLAEIVKKINDQVRPPAEERMGQYGP